MSSEIIRPGLFRKQNKHVLRPSRGKGYHTNWVTRQFILSARSGTSLRLKSMHAIILETVASATAEMPFSVLRRLKTYVRSTMKNDRLSSLGLMHILTEILK
jgi:hypothetical protein